MIMMMVVMNDNKFYHGLKMKIIFTFAIFYRWASLKEREFSCSENLKILWTGKRYSGNSLLKWQKLKFTLIFICTVVWQFSSQTVSKHRDSC